MHQTSCSRRALKRVACDEDIPVATVTDIAVSMIILCGISRLKNKTLRYRGDADSAHARNPFSCMKQFGCRRRQSSAPYVVAMSSRVMNVPQLLEPDAASGGS